MNKQEKRRTIVYYALLASMLIFFTWVFIEIVDELRENEIQAFDLAVIEEVQSWINEGRTSFMIAITDLGSILFFSVGTTVGTVLLIWKKRYSYAVFLPLTVLFGAGFNWVLKEIFKRQRPDILPLIEQGGYSFPSGHSMGSFIFYGAVAFVLFELLDRKWLRVGGMISAFALVLVIGLTRIYLGVHYPSDVIAGFSIGAAWLLFAIASFHYYEDRVRKRRENECH